MGRFIQYYRENAKYLERTHGFVTRLGIEKIRAIVMEDSEGIAERLDREIAAAKDCGLKTYPVRVDDSGQIVLSLEQA
jgi:nitrite reductase (NADH) large subunit